MNKKIFIILVGSNFIIFSAALETKQTAQQKAESELAKALRESAVDEEERLFRQALAESEFLERSRKESVKPKPKEDVADKDLERALAESLAESKKEAAAPKVEPEVEFEMQPGAPSLSGAVVVTESIVAPAPAVVAEPVIAPAAESKEEVAAQAAIPAEPEFKANEEEKEIEASLQEALKKLNPEQKLKRKAACQARVV